MNIERVRSCAYTILDNAQAIMMESNRNNVYHGYLLEKIKIIENDLQVIKQECLKGDLQ